MKIADFLRNRLFRLSRGVGQTPRLPSELGEVALKVLPQASLTFWLGLRLSTRFQRPGRAGLPNHLSAELQHAGIAGVRGTWTIWLLYAGQMSLKETIPASWSSLFDV